MDAVRSGRRADPPSRRPRRFRTREQTRGRHLTINTEPAWVIVGAGFTGSVLAERIASQLDQRVWLVDRRTHIGGNAFDELDEHGILVHRYGPHIFHTNAPRIWNYLSHFTAWRPYEHRVLGSIDGCLVPIPFNLDSLRALVPGHARLERRLVERFGHGSRVPVQELRRSDDPELRRLGELVFERVFAGYTAKQWGRLPDELDAAVLARVPVAISHDDRYFADRYQAMPAEGYSELFRRLLDHPNIEVGLGVAYRDCADRYPAARMVYTGAVDELLDFRFGLLPYRSMRFESTTLAVDRHQPVATINYPDDRPYTRVTEQKQVTGQVHPRTTLVTEYPGEHVPGANEPHYPVPQPENRILHRRYLELARRELGERVLIAGRLGDYRYYNMDQAVGRALALFDQVRSGRWSPARRSEAAG